MKKHSPLVAVLILTAFLFSISNAYAAPKIVDLTKHLSTDNNYKNASVFDKMKIIAKLIQDGRISSYDKLVTHTVKDLVDQYMTLKGKDDPTNRLKAFAELKKLNERGKDLYRLSLKGDFCSVDFIKYLTSAKNYTNADYKTKIQFLQKLKSDDIWSDSFGQAETEKVVIAHIEEEALNLGPAGKGKKALQILSSLKKSKLLSWGGFYSGAERVYLNIHLSQNKEYINMNPRQKMDYLAQLEKDKLITSFLRSDAESSIVAVTLINNAPFNRLSHGEKEEYVEKMQKNKEIHLFSKGKILKLLGLEN